MLHNWSIEAEEVYIGKTFENVRISKDVNNHFYDKESYQVYRKHPRNDAALLQLGNPFVGTLHTQPGEIPRAMRNSRNTV